MSDWYEKAKAKKEKKERQKRLKEQNFLRLINSGLLKKIESVANEVNNTTLHKIQHQIMGSERIEVFVDSETVHNYQEPHFNIYVTHEGVFLKYGARRRDYHYSPIPIYSEPKGIEPETVTEIDIREWMGHLVDDKSIENQLYNQESIKHQDSIDDLPTFFQHTEDSEQHSPIAIGCLWIVLSIMVPLIVVMVLYFLSKLGCK